MAARNHALNPDYAIGIFAVFKNIEKERNLCVLPLKKISPISICDLGFFLRKLCVRLSDLRVEVMLNSIQDQFNAEAGEPDAEFGENHAIVIFSTK